MNPGRYHFLRSLFVSRGNRYLLQQVKPFVQASIAAIVVLLQPAATWAVVPIEPPVGPEGKTSASTIVKTSRATKDERCVIEFSGDEIDVVLRSLARRARMNVVLSPTVQGTVNLRLENTTNREVLEVICQANGFEIQELNGVHYIRSWDDKFKGDANKMAHVLKLMLDAYVAKGFTRVEAMELIKTPGIPRIELSAEQSSAKPPRRR